MEKGRCLRISMLVYCISNVVIGLGLIACGAWMHASQDVYAYITVFVRALHDYTLVAAAALILIAGIFLFLFSFLGIFGIWKRNPKAMLAYMYLSFLIFILGIVAGFMTVALYYDIHMNVKPAMQSQLNEYYQWDNKLGMAWNRVQVKKRCCGADGSWDYGTTNWFNENNPVDEEPKVYVPDSCCVLNFNQDRDLYWVDPQKLQLKDAKRCQEDAAGRTGNSANLHGKGCYAALFSINKDLFRDVTIFSVIFVIEGLGLGAGFLQLFGIALTYFYIASMKTEAEQPALLKVKQ